jgi:hydroxymethylpyrimidine pyrophosphatase-like HAD family hydrolase
MPMLEFKFGDPLKHEVYKMLPAFLNEEECKMFEKMIGNSYEIRRQKGMFAYDVTSKNIHKGEAVKKVLEYLDITKDVD